MVRDLHRFSIQVVIQLLTTKNELVLGQVDLLGDGGRLHRAVRHPSPVHLLTIFDVVRVL